MLTAQDIMTRDVVTVKKDMSVSELARLLSEKKISGVPVVDDQGNLIGIVTENDLVDQKKKVHIPTVMALFDSFVFLENPDRLEKDLKKMSAATVGDISTGEVITAGTDTPLDELATIMSEKNVHTLPILDQEGNLAGIIGKTDIIRTIMQDK
ncbi:MAG: CBS domain-containing protein [Desulfobulbaceae bacterium]|nr:CBS domain-containing protein [Desulfobulbaceae bacterium]